MRALLLLLLLPASLPGGRGADLVRSIRTAGLDAGECYRVRDISFARDEAQIFLSDGYLMFGKAAGGGLDARVTAVFSAETEGGDAELLLLPPNRAERGSLAKHSGSPNLDEHFTNAIFVFADQTHREIMEQIAANPYIKKAPEMGLLLAGKWGPVVQNLNGSFGLRLALDLLSPSAARQGFFAAAMVGKKLGAFDLVYDGRGREQLVAGQSDGSGFDVWTSFVSRSFRARKYEPEFQASDYRIDSVIDPGLKLQSITRLKVRPAAGSEGALPFEISRQMHVTAASIDGEPAELLANDAPRSSIESAYGNDLFALIPARPLAPGKTYEVEIRHEGQVISDAGNKVYFVGSRGTWFPGRGAQFAKFDLTFRFPKELDLVASGDLTDEHVEGELKVSRRVTQFPIRLVGFNLGFYERTTVKRAGLTIEVCANRNAEHALQPKPAADPLWIPPPGPVRRVVKDGLSLPAAPVIPPNPSERLEMLAANLADMMDFYSARFGPAPIRTLEVSPVPGRFGQGFPGLIYLSTLSYVQPFGMNRDQNLFFTELLQAHEAAHQWWGNVVSSAGYHDDWVMESMANYSALMFIEKKKGVKAMDGILQSYRSQLLAKTAEGETVESHGPVVQGMRVDGNWNTVVYGKGTWIVHMLRRRMGDDAFLKMLAALRKQFEDKTIATDEFRIFCAGFLPPKSEDPKLESFFDQWVYGTGIPELKLNYKVTGKAPLWRVTGTITQSLVDDDFTADVPVEIQTGRPKPVTLTVRASNEPTSFSASLKAAPIKVAIESRSILTR